mgnify:CR=1 FL=1
MDNVWNKIPLEDYECHMQHASVGQLQLLNNLTKRYLNKLCPEIVMFLGIAGGNGLEHIDNKVTKEVLGVDLNQSYLDETARRFKDKIPLLHLLNIDISSAKTEELTRADFIWAALIFEYVATDVCFRFISNNINENGYVTVTIQANNGVSSVSQTGIESIKTAGQIFRIVPESELLISAEKFGFYQIDFEEHILPNKKSLKTYTFSKKNSEPKTMGSM